MGWLFGFVLDLLACWFVNVVWIMCLCTYFGLIVTVDVAVWVLGCCVCVALYCGVCCILGFCFANLGFCGLRVGFGFLLGWVYLVFGV